MSALTALAETLPALAKAEIACRELGARDGLYLCMGLRVLLAGIIETEAEEGSPERSDARQVLTTEAEMAAEARR